jgi:hypothetical protein
MSALAVMARAYARRGWPVIPLHQPVGDGCSCGRSGCTSTGKHPRLRHGLLEASTDAGDVTRWWRRWPSANVGVVTGATAGLVVLDVDGAIGEAALDELEARHGALGRPARSRTGSGYHLLYRHPGGRLPNSASKLGPGLDVRGDGGFVVAPPSLHASGHHYRWCEAPAPGELPGWLLGLLRPPPRARVVPRVRPAGGRSAYSAAALRAEVAQVAGAVNGTRNHILNRSAFSLGTLVGAGALEEVVVIDALVSAALSSGLGETEARHTIASGLRAGVGAPRVLETVTGGPA